MMFMKNKNFRILVTHSRRNLIDLDKSSEEESNNIEDSIGSSTDEELRFQMK